MNHNTYTEKMLVSFSEVTKFFQRNLYEAKRRDTKGYLKPASSVTLFSPNVHVQNRNRSFKNVTKIRSALLKNNEYCICIAEASIFALSLFIYRNNTSDLVLITDIAFSMTKGNDKLARTHQKPSEITST